MPQFKGSELIEASRETVWGFLTDPNKVGNCAPGLKKLDVTDQDHFSVEVKVGLGFLRGTVKAKYETLEKNPPEKLTLRILGSGIGSQVDIKAMVGLKEVEQNKTQLDWVADVKLSGMLAGLGGRYINDAAYKNVSELFKCTREKLKGK